MYTFRELQKSKSLIVEGSENRLAVLGNCSTQFLSDAIEGLGRLEGINITVYDAPYNQIDALLLDKSSEVYTLNPDEILLWLCSEKLYEEFLDLPIKMRSEFANNCIGRLKNYWDIIKRSSNAKILQLNFVEINDKPLGELSAKVPSTFVYQIRKLNYLLQEEISKDKAVYPVDIQTVQIYAGRDNCFNAPLYYNAKMPISIGSIPSIAYPVIRVIKSMMGSIKKCIVLDLDNTLWGGVIGDDGLGGIEIGHLGRGHVFTNIQKWLKQLKEYGVILAICSKNEEAIAKEPFEKHEEMVLRLDDIAVFVANWNDKASNIKMIQETLNIGLDSMVFLDDNEFERNLVKEKLPNVEVPDLPEDPSLWLDLLYEMNYFDTASYVGENTDRTKLYQAEYERRKDEQQFGTIDDYLKSMGMIGFSHAFEESKYARIAELTQRSNQFNLRTIRYTEGDIQRIANDDKYITRYYTLKDKYGDHGLVSVVILEERSKEELFIETWLMSCRVLKRGMEEYIINNLVEIAKEQNYKTITAEYIPTKKNLIVKELYSNLGFSKIDDNHYYKDIKTHVQKETFIKEED